MFKGHLPKTKPSHEIRPKQPLPVELLRPRTKPRARQLVSQYLALYTAERNYQLLLDIYRRAIATAATRTPLQLPG